MPDERILKLSGYGISKERYQELKAFCRQYREKKAKIADAQALPSSAPTGLPHGTGVSDRTGRQASRLAALSADVELIESTCRDAAPCYWKYLLENVTTGTCFEYLSPPCGRRQFYEQRRKFFYLLDMRKG